MIAASALWICWRPMSSRQAASIVSAEASMASSASLSGPQTGICPSQFLTIIDSDRLARLPMPLARSELMRVAIPSSL